MRKPVNPPLLAQMLETARLRALTPTNEPVSAEQVAELHRRKSQAQVDHIQRRDRAWDDALAGRS